MSKFVFTLLLVLIGSISMAQTLEHTYHFQQPLIESRDGYQQISWQGCAARGQVGEPTLPYQTVSLVLPQGFEAYDITVEYNNFVELDGEYNLYPYQLPRTYSEDKVIPFAKDETIYRSTETYPQNLTSKVTTQYLNGVGIAFSGFTPARYIPATGKICYAQDVTVRIEMQGCRYDNSRKLWLTAENKSLIEGIAQNNEMLSTYNSRGREVAGYDMLVIAQQDWVERLQEYVDFHNSRGIRTRIATLEDIYPTCEGRDNQEKIRMYIIKEYEDNGISMVSLAGDVSIMPYRSLYCFAQEGYEDQLPADMYYASLDGTLNDNNNDRWGEVGEDDLLPELSIGRLPFNNQEQFDVIMHKTFSYLTNPVLGEFTSPVLGGEHLGDGYYGETDLERLIGGSSDYDYTTVGYPTDYNFKKYYATPSMDWNASAFKGVIRTGGQYVHHVGHANADYVAGWTGSTMGDNFFAGNDGVEHNFMLFHSHGCICGDFPSSCVLEKMVTIPTGFVMTMGNSRYGWYVPWGDGMAAHIHRELVDGYCKDHLAFVGAALRKAKISTAPYVTMYGEDGCMRWNIYCLNELGDVALTPWFREPFIPEVAYRTGLITGTTSTDVTVSYQGQALDNFRCSLYHGEELLGFAITDAEGNATLELSRPVSDDDTDMTLVILGQSAWPQQYHVEGFAQGQCFIFSSDQTYNDHGNGNGNIEFGEAFSIDVDLSNVGDVTANNIISTISADQESVTITHNTLDAGTINANSTATFSDAFSFTVADDAVDMTRVIFTFENTDGTHTWSNSAPIYLMAPVLQFTQVVIDDSEGNQNGLIDQGEPITLHVYGKNAGHATAPNIHLSAACSSQDITVTLGEVNLGNLDVNEEFEADITFVSDENIIGGTLFNMAMELTSGAYEVLFDYAFSVGYATETFESGDFSFMEWDFAGDLPWTITDEETHSGNYCAKSGAIEDDEISSLIVSTNILIDGDISFWFKTDSEKHDYLVFYVDNKVIKYWGGEKDWTQFTHHLTAGDHVIEFRYDKSPQNSAGADAVYLDDIIFPGACIVTDLMETTTPHTIELLPNPTDGPFTLLLGEEDNNINIFNSLGQSILQLQAARGTQVLDMTGYPSGMYFVEVKNASQTKTIKLIIK